MMPAPPPILAQDAITKYRSLVGLNNTYFSVLEAGKSEIAEQSHLLVGKDPPPGLQMAAFPLYLHMM